MCVRGCPGGAATLERGYGSFLTMDGATGSAGTAQVRFKPYPDFLCKNAHMRIPGMCL